MVECVATIVGNALADQIAFLNKSNVLKIIIVMIHVHSL